MKQISTTLFTLILFLTPAYGQGEKENATIKRIDAYLSKLEMAGFDGSVLVELNGEKKISKGFGYSDKVKRIKNSPNTLFDIGSITKQFTAAAILKLEMDGKLSTDDNISKYFKNVPEDKIKITIHDLLRHQSGLIANVGKDYEKISQEDFLIKLFSSKLKFEVGSKFAYSNIGYSLLAMIIEKVSYQSYETYLYENLWKPAQMEMTGYTRPALDTSLIAVGYSSENKFWGKPTDKEWDKTAPYWHLKGNGGILSTTEDMYKWHRCLMTELVLSTEAKQKLYYPEIRPEETNTSYYAYGWDVSQTERKTTRVWHSGTNHIFYADFMRFIDEGVTLIMLSNKWHPNFTGLNFEISKIIFQPVFKPEIPAPDNEVNRAFTKHIIKTIEDFSLEKAKTEYDKGKKSARLLEFLMRNEGFDHIDNNQPDKAIQIFEMNVMAHPKSAKALQGLGEGYMETGKKVLALKYFRQSLSIDPDNPFVKNMIEKLEPNEEKIAEERPPVKCMENSPERRGEEGCTILTNRPLLGNLTNEIYWHMDRFDSLEAAAKAAGPNGVAAEAHGSFWLMTVEARSEDQCKGHHVARIGPLLLPPKDQYSMRVQSSLLRPGSVTPVHTHSGPEVFYIVDGEQCIEMPEGGKRLSAGQSFIVPLGDVHRGRVIGSASRKALALILYDAAYPASLDLDNPPQLDSCK